MKMKKKVLDLLIKLFSYLRDRIKIRTGTMDTIFNGVGTGIIANVMFVLTTSKNYQILNLTISFVLAIILLLIGSIERKDK